MTKTTKGLAMAIAVALAVPALADTQEGEKVFKQKCKMCHAINGQGGKIGPDLSKEGGKRDEQYLITKLKDPTKDNPDSVMPSFDSLSDKEFHAVIEYLKSLK